ncbi:MAG TPA: endolytic transglycosylase MltG [Candidatus Acidoferrum sp.]|nr:endolytic transglycosylase MltG [Candidatus Acidoferrum sp.]
MRRAIIVLIFLLVAAGGAWLVYSLFPSYQAYQPPGVFVDIPKGASARTIARILESQGVIRSQWAFDILCRTRPRRKLVAGEYYFQQPETAFEVFDTIAAGRIFEISVTVPEGFNSFQIATLLEEKGLVARDDFLAAARDATPIRDLAPNAPSVEGFLFPATYQFPRHLTAKDAIAAMTTHFRTVWNSLQPGDPPTTALSPDQILILASMVESETPKPDERPMVAGVFMNRLRKGMLLESDPTVVYALEQAGKYKGVLTTADLRFDSPYNTYRYKGLPPGPIANPGEASLRAAREPAAVDYLYFVADTEGGHFFSKTLAEHNRNVERYHQLLKQKNHKEPAPPRRGQRQP